MKSFIYGLVLSFILISCGYIHNRAQFDEYPKSKVMQLTGNGIACSGEQVEAASGQTYILSAGHCMGMMHNGNVTVTTEDGRTLERRVIAEDGYSDLMLIEGVPGMGGLRIAKHSERFQHVRTFTHGARLQTYKTEGFLIEKKELILPIFQITPDSPSCNSPKYKIESMDSWGGDRLSFCILDIPEFWMSAAVVPGSSGGMVVNDSGEVIGVVSIQDGPFGGMVDQVEINHFLNNY